MNINLNDFLYIIATSWIPESGDLFIFVATNIKTKECPVLNKLTVPKLKKRLCQD